MQLDLFLHGADVALRNAVIAALNARDAAAMGDAIDQLRAGYPQECRLADFERLHFEFSSLDQPDHAGAAMEQQLENIETKLLPALQSVIGAGAQRWLEPVYAELAVRASGQPFTRDSAHTHAAGLFLRSGALPEARAAIKQIPSWRRIPEPLAWMTEIALRENAPAEYWPLIAELAWIAPALIEAQFANGATHKAPLSVLRLYQEFCSKAELDTEDDESAWFPAWLLLEHPELLPLLRTAQPHTTPPARCAFLLIDLLLGERMGASPLLVDKRKELRDRAPILFRCYMARR